MEPLNFFNWSKILKKKPAENIEDEIQQSQHTRCLSTNFTIYQKSDCITKSRCYQ